MPHTSIRIVPDIIDQMMREAWLDNTAKVLVPYAGDGQIADHVRPHVVSVDVTEKSFRHRSDLAQKGYRIVADDFLEWSAGEVGDRQPYSRILLFPPDQHILHLNHAWEHWLAPGGILVALVVMDAPTASLNSLLWPSVRTVKLPAYSFNVDDTSTIVSLVSLYKPKEG